MKNGIKKKELDKWLDRQINNYNTKKDLVYNNESVKKAWEEFISNDKYKLYFNLKDG